jgi:hypothetical protein
MAEDKTQALPPDPVDQYFASPYFILVHHSLPHRLSLLCWGARICLCIREHRSCEIKISFNFEGRKKSQLIILKTEIYFP